MVALVPSRMSASASLTVLDCCVPSGTPVGLVAREDSAFGQSLGCKVAIYQPDTPRPSLRERGWSYWSEKSELTVSTEATTATASLNLRSNRSSPSSPSNRNVGLVGSQTTALLDTFGPADLRDQGTDAQGIPWSRFSIAREDYRVRRMHEFTNYNNVPWTARLEVSRRLSITSPSRLHEFFVFGRNYRTIAATIDHFQLRQLLHTVDNNHAYFVANSTLQRFNKVTGAVARVHSQTGNQMACAHVAHGFAVSGAFDSEVNCSKLVSAGAGAGAGTVVFRKKVSHAENSITNSVLLAKDAGENYGDVKVLVGNNDQTLKEIDVTGKTGTVLSDHLLPWPVNHVSCNDRNLLCVAGDACEALLLDRRSQEKAGTLTGHLDFVFCSDWQNEFTVATGSQDGTCRVFDIRNTQTPLKVLGTVLGAARSVRFSSCKKFLAFSEPSDYIHLYDVQSNYRDAQVLDFFGNIAGIAFSPDSSRLSVAISDSMFGCLLEFRRCVPSGEDQL